MIIIINNTMSDKRRLSHGSSVHDLHIEDDDFDIDDDFDVDKRKSIGSTSSRSSRRQSFGSALSSARNAKNSAQEQNRIAEMYKTVIKLSSENVRNGLLSIIIPNNYGDSCQNFSIINSAVLFLLLIAENHCQEFLEPRSD